MTKDTCPLCGAQIPEGKVNCRTLFDELLALEYTDPLYASVHLLTVDAYVLQHSEDHGPRSNAFHLMRLCWIMEHSGEAAIGSGSPNNREQFERAYREFPFLEPPDNRGQMTVADAYLAVDAVEYRQRVRDWAQSVWDAWEIHHDWARKMARRLMVP